MMKNIIKKKYENLYFFFDFFRFFHACYLDNIRNILLKLLPQQIYPPSQFLASKFVQRVPLRQLNETEISDPPILKLIERSIRRHIN